MGQIIQQKNIIAIGGGKARVAGEIVITLFGGIVFWITNEIFLILGRGGIVPPFWSAWGVNFLFALLGIVLLLRGK